MPPSDDLLKQQSVEAYPTLYERVIAGWQQPGPDGLWLLYSANYLVRVGPVRWAVDPITLPTRLSGTLPPHPLRDFSPLDFIVLTHQHRDHVSWDFLKSLTALPAPWIVPPFMVQACLDQTGIPSGQIIPAIPGQWIDIRGIKILPCEGFHWEYAPESNASAAPIKGLPSAAYLFEFSGKRWYFPGDVRSYDVSRLPDLGRLDGIVAHVWMGRRTEAQSEPPLLRAFCDYFARFNTSRLVLTHLYEMGRAIKDRWTIEDAQKIIAAFRDSDPSLTVDARITGEAVQF